MKKIFVTLIIALPIVFGCSQSNYIQDTQRVALAEFNASNFRFMATSARSMTRGARLLEGGYDVILKNDTLFSQLPYYGVSNSAPISGSDESGIRFTTTKFSASKNSSGSENLELVIEIEGQRFVRTMTFMIFKDGSATLDVLSNFRDAMSFQGHITTIPASQNN